MRCSHERVLHPHKAGEMGCHGVDWSSAVAETLAPTSPVMVNVGANKGYAIRDFAQLWAVQPISPAEWHRATGTSSHMPSESVRAT